MLACGKLSHVFKDVTNRTKENVTTCLFSSINSSWFSKITIITQK